MNLCKSLVASNMAKFTLNFAKRTNPVSSFLVKRHLNAEVKQNRELSLRTEIVQRIKACGPITVAEYMNMVLTNPISGFYMNQDVFGSKGHFTTSPEISQIFGELIAVWLLNEWQRFGCPKPFKIVEFGPGRGTLANDIARVMLQFSHSKDVTSLHLIEVSPHLTQIQEQNLCETISLIEKQNNAVNGTHSSLTKSGMPITWYRSLDQVPIEPGFTAFIAHEFFDALPIHKFMRTENGKWREILIDFDENNELRYVVARNPTPASKLFIDPAETCNHLEVSPQSALVVDNVINRLNQNKTGCFLICDYGYDFGVESKYRDTFRAFRTHDLWDPLKEPGTADLTADVDFGYLKRQIGEKALVFGTVNQKPFLQNLGIQLRLSKLIESATSEGDKNELQSGVEMLLNEMGERYKFLSLFPSTSQQLFVENPPAGFVQN